MSTLDPGYGVPPVPDVQGAPTIRLPKGYTLLPQAPASSGSMSPTLDATALAKEPNPNVRSLVMGNFDPMLMRKWTPDAVADVMRRAQQYDPNIDMSNYPAKAQAKKAFTSGKAADAIRSINQFIGHVNSLADAEATLGNADNIFPTATNWVGNTIGSQFRPELKKNLGSYEAVRQAVANEYQTMVAGSSTAAGVHAREEAVDALGPNASPSAIRGWIDGALKVMHSRLNELNDQYKQGTGLQYGFDALNPQSKSILRRFGVQADDRGGGPETVGQNRGQGQGQGQYQLEKSDTLGGKELIYYPAGQAPNSTLRYSGSPPPSTSRPGAPSQSTPVPPKVLINDTRIDKFMKDNHITDRGQAIRILQQHGVI